MVHEKIRVGFIPLGSTMWMAGHYYLRHLFAALRAVEDIGIEPVLFIGKKQTDAKLTELFNSYALLVRSSIIDSPILRSIDIGTKRRFLFNYLLKKNSISVLSHANMPGRLSCRRIGWIPDFQHFRLPEMFTAWEIERRNLVQMNVLKNFDRVILSSASALDDLRSFAPDYAYKARILRFVAQPHEGIYDLTMRGELESKYGFKGKFFLLPNQLWKHKNHITVFKAVNILKKEGKEILILCTGHTADYRNESHIGYLKGYIAENGLQDNVKVLGLIEYADVLTLMRNCISIVNPSLFEGWSTSVEEAKSIGKSVILSKIPTHVEQSPPSGVYFEPKDPDELAGILWRRWQESEGGPDSELEEKARQSIGDRTRSFALEYQKIIMDTVNNNS